MHSTSKSSSFKKKHFKGLVICLLLLTVYQPAIGGVSPYSLKKDINEAIKYFLNTTNQAETTAEGKGKKKKESGKHHKHEKPPLETSAYNYATRIEAKLGVLLWQLGITKVSNDTGSNDKDINTYTEQSEENTDFNAEDFTEDFEWLLMYGQSDSTRNALEEIISADREPDEEKVTCSLLRPRKKAHKQLKNTSEIEETEDSPALIKFKQLFAQHINQTNTESTKVDGDPSKNITTDATVAPHTEQPTEAEANNPQEINPDSASGTMKEKHSEDNQDDTEKHQTPDEAKFARTIFEPSNNFDREPISSTTLNEQIS